MISIYQLYWMD